MRSGSRVGALAMVIGVVVATGGLAHAARPPAGPPVGAQTSGTVVALHGGAESPVPPRSLKCTPPDRPRQIWDCSPAPCKAHLVWRCELWCPPGHYPTLVDVRKNGGKAKCVKHGLP